MANKYLITGGGNWSGSSWNTASNQATSNTTAPTTSDVAILDQYSGPVTIDTTTCVASSVSGSTYANTITFGTGNKLTSSGAVTIGASATIAGTGELQWNSGALNITPTFTGNVTGSSTSAKTIGTNLTVQGLLKWNNTCGFTGAGINIYAQGGYTGGTATAGAYWSSTSGNPNLYLQGGTIYGTIGGASSNIYFDGNVTLTTGTTYKQDIRTNATVQWISGATTTTDAILRFISSTTTINTGTHIQWDYIQFTTNTYTLAANLYVNNLLTLTGSPTINGAGYKVIVAENVICYGVATYGGTFDGIEMTGTGTLFYPTSPAGQTLDSEVTMNCNIIINTSGTITHQNKTILWGGGKTLTYTAGTFNTTGGAITWTSTTGGYNFNAPITALATLNASVETINLLDDFTVTNVNISTGATLTTTADLTVTNLNQSSGSYFRPSSASVVTVGTSITDTGTPSSNVYYLTRQTLTDFVGGKIATFTDSSYAVSEDPLLTSNGHSVLYQRSGSTYDTWANLNSVIDLGTDFTVAFTYKHMGGGTIAWSGTGAGFRRPSADNYIYVYLSGSIYSRSVAYTWVTGQSYRIVITKASADSRAKFYVNGVQLSDYGITSGTTTGASLNGISTIGYSYGNYGLDEFVFFDAVKDQTWVDTDWNNGVVKTYDSAEANIIAGFHMDDDIVSTLTYNGTDANCFITCGYFVGVDASLSAIRIYDWKGTKYTSENIYAVTGNDIGGGGVSVTHY